MCTSEVIFGTAITTAVTTACAAFRPLLLFSSLAQLRLTMPRQKPSRSRAKASAVHIKDAALSGIPSRPVPDGVSARRCSFARKTNEASLQARPCIGIGSRSALPIFAP